MVAQITAGDNEIGADVEADHQEYMSKIQKMIEDAPSMDAIIAVTYKKKHKKKRAVTSNHPCGVMLYAYILHQRKN